MKFKSSVRLHSFHSFDHVIDAVDKAFIDVVGHESMMTSANDSKHSKNSLHYSGNAWDFRIRRCNNINQEVYDKSICAEITHRIAGYLGNFYDVVLELDHIHVEYDPK